MLDYSWGVVLERAFAERWQFGEEVVFTYGPLGFLAGNAMARIEALAPLVLGNSLLSLVLATAALAVGRRLAGGRALLFYGFVALLGSWPPVAHLTAVALLGFELIRGATGAGDWRRRAGLAGLALFAAVKFTHLLLASAFVLIFFVLSWYRGRRRDALFGAGEWAAALTLVWLACGQDLAGAWPYLRSSWQLVSAYSEGMAVPAPAGALALGLAVGLLLGVALVGALRAGAERDRGWALAAAVALFLFVSFKQAFGRADAPHLVQFFLSTLLVALLIPDLFPSRAGVRPRMGVPVGLVALLSLVSLVRFDPAVGRGLLLDPLRAIAGNARALVAWSAVRADSEAVLARIRAAVDLPRMRDAIGDGAVDLIGWDQALVELNRFRYRPRPVFQSYATLSEPLARLNASFFAGDRAPEFVLVRLRTIDDRLPGLDDALVLRRLPRLYEYVLTEKGVQLWRRRPVATPEPALVPLASGRLAGDGRIDLPDGGGRAIWARLELPLTPVDRARNVLHKASSVHVEVEDEFGNRSRWLLPRRMAAAGFLLQPLLDSEFALLELASNRTPRRIRSLQVVAPPPGDALERARFELSSVPSFGDPGAALEDERRRAFAPLATVPERFHSAEPASVREIDGRPVLLVRTPSQLVFDARGGHGGRGRRTLRGTFTLLQARIGDRIAGGAVVTVHWRLGSETIELSRRELRPAARPADRGPQKFEIALPETAAGEIVLSATPLGSDGPGGLAAWVDVELATAESSDETGAAPVSPSAGADRPVS